MNDHSNQKDTAMNNYDETTAAQDDVEQAAMNAAWLALEAGGTDDDIEQAAMDAAWTALEARP